MVGSNTVSKASDNDGAALANGSSISEDGPVVSVVMLHAAFQRMPPHMRWEFYARYTNTWPDYTVSSMAMADSYLTKFVDQICDTVKPLMLDGVETKLTEYLAFREKLHMKYSAASNIALDYLVLMKGEHGLLEYLFGLEVVSN